MQHRIVLLLALCGLPALAHAQAWTQEPGAVYLKITQGFANASERYDASGEAVPYDANLDTETDGTPFRDRSRYLYGEVGLAQSLTLFGTLPYKRLFITDGGFDTPVEREATDLGSAVFGLRVGLEDAFGLDDRSAVGANVALIVPLGYRRNFAPAVGPGQVDAQFLLAYGRSLWPVPAYAQAGVGYRYRTSVFDLSRVVECPARQPDDAETLCLSEGGNEVAYSDELLAKLEVGYTLFGRLLLQGMLDVVWSVDEPEPVVSAAGVQPEAFPQQRYVRTGFGATLTVFSGTGLSVQAFTAPYARNALRAVEIFAGIETKF
jgi:hypothetical protein